MKKNLKVTNKLIQIGFNCNGDIIFEIKNNFYKITENKTTNKIKQLSVLSEMINSLSEVRYRLITGEINIKLK